MWWEPSATASRWACPAAATSGCAAQSSECLAAWQSPGPLLPHLLVLVPAWQVDLASGEGLAACLNALPRLAVIVNCSAISVPAACERDPQRARCPAAAGSTHRRLAAGRPPAKPRPQPCCRAPQGAERAHQAAGGTGGPGGAHRPAAAPGPDVHRHGVRRQPALVEGGGPHRPGAPVRRQQAGGGAGHPGAATCCRDASSRLQPRTCLCACPPAYAWPVASGPVASWCPRRRLGRTTPSCAAASSTARSRRGRWSARSSCSSSTRFWRSRRAWSLLPRLLAPAVEPLTCCGQQARRLACVVAGRGQYARALPGAEAHHLFPRRVAHARVRG